MAIVIRSTSGHIGFLSFYIGWDSNPRPRINSTDCGDETFGIAYGDFYIGHYSGSGWAMGFLDEYGCLK